jgi:TPR repeat protein
VKAKIVVLARAAVVCAASMVGASAQTSPSCASFTVVFEDTLHNVKQGLSADDLKWFRDKMAKKYPAACYADPASDVPVVFYIRVTPDIYHGTQVINNTSTQSNPVNGTITDESGNTAQINGTQKTTTTTSTAVPYSVEYGIFTLSVERKQHDGTYLVMQTFQQKGLYNTLYGIPLGGRGHHPAHAVIEDAAKWVDGGGLTDQRQGSLQQAQPNSSLSLGLGTRPHAKTDAENAVTQNDLGNQYHDGKGITQDYAQAALWYRKAADQGLAEAQYNLGLDYDRGQGVTQDYSQAAVWYRKAADQGLASAQFGLGHLYHLGRGVPQDYGQAAAWYGRAADQGIAGGELGLGVLYDHGQGVPQDFKEAAIWYRKAANQGIRDAQAILGIMYDEGRGVSQDYVESYF